MKLTLFKASMHAMVVSRLPGRGAQLLFLFLSCGLPATTLQAAVSCNAIGLTFEGLVPRSGHLFARARHPQKESRDRCGCEPDQCPCSPAALGL